MDKTFTVQTTVNFQDLWNAIWSSDGGGSTYWANQVRSTKNKDGVYEMPLKLYDGEPRDFQIHDFEEGKWHTVTLDDLAEGYQIAVTQNLTHCGHHRVADLENGDACSGDLLLQLAIFKEIVYG